MPKEALSVGDLVHWYDYYHDGIVSDGGLGIVLQTRVYEYTPPTALEVGDGTFAFPEYGTDVYSLPMDDPARHGQKRSHRHIQYFVYKTKLMVAEWLPREWLAAAHCKKKQ